MVVKDKSSPVGRGTGAEEEPSHQDNKAIVSSNVNGLADTGSEKQEDMDMEHSDLAPLFDSDEDNSDNSSRVDTKLIINQENINGDNTVVVGLDLFSRNHYDKDQDVSVLVFYMKNIYYEKIDFHEKEIILWFKTRDEKTLTHNTFRRYDEHQLFKTVIPLKHAIVATESSYKKASMSLELILKKAIPMKWDQVIADSPEDNSFKNPNPLTNGGAWPPGEPKPAPAAIPLPPPPPTVFSTNNNQKLSTSWTKPSTSQNSWTVSKPVVGYTGLDNLGNTCFMNSVIQCLSNTQELRDYFVSSDFKEDLNQTNPLGTGGHLAMSFAVLLAHLWSGKHHSYSPLKLKSLMGEKVSQFSGFAQHDAQEYMAYLLDAVHEDVNRIRVKPYIEMPSSDADDAPVADEVLADDSWKKYRMRNDSIIVDFFQGQYKSKLVCPECNKVSVTFDPFLYLSVPLPKNKIFHNVFFFSLDTSKKPVRHVVKLPADAKVSVLHDALKKRVNCERLKTIIVSNGNVHRTLKETEIVPNLGNSDQSSMILVFQMLTSEEAGEDVVEFIVKQRLLVPKQSGFCSSCKQAPEGSSLKKCTKCYRVGYCTKDCQTKDWPEHQKNCSYVEEPVGCPFIISVPYSKCTFNNLQQILSDYSRYSVDVQGVSRKNSVVSGDDDSSEIDYEPLPKRKFDIRYFPDTESTASDAPGTNLSEGIVLRGPKPETESTEKEQVIVNRNSSSRISYLNLVWLNNTSNQKSVVVESKDLDHSYDVLEAENERKTDNFVTLEDCLKAFTEPETLGEQEAWYCPRCKKHREATKQLQLWRLPSLLIVQLKRFSFRNMLFREKIDKFVEFPLEDLDLSEFCSPNSHREGIPKPIYDLYGVINHYGGMFGGHYVAFAKTAYGGQEMGWRVFDDSRVHDIREDEVVNRNAYILLYRLREDSS